MYVLTWNGTPLVACEERERLCEYQSLYTVAQQQDQEIREVQVIK